MRSRVTLSVLALGALTAAAIGTPVARLHAQSQGATADDRSRPAFYDLFVRYERSEERRVGKEC